MTAKLITTLESFKFRTNKKYLDASMDFNEHLYDFFMNVKENFTKDVSNILVSELKMLIVKNKMSN